MDSPQCTDTLHIGRGNATYNTQFGYSYNQKIVYDKLKMCSDCSDKIVKGEKLKRCSVCLAWDCNDDIDGLLDEGCPPNVPLDCSILKSNGKLPCWKITLLQLSKAVDEVHQKCCMVTRV